MKKVLLFVFALILGGFGAFAQTSVGVKFGPSYTVTQGNLKNDFGNGGLRFHAGLFTRENMGKVNVLFEAVYVQTSVGRLNISSLNIPLMLETNCTKLNFQIGVSPSIVLINNKSDFTEGGGNIKPFNVDIAAGIRYQISDKIGINARYSVPVLSYNTNDTRYYAPMNVSLSLNYTLKTFL